MPAGIRQRLFLLQNREAIEVRIVEVAKITENIKEMY